MVKHKDTNNPKFKQGFTDRYQCGFKNSKFYNTYIHGCKLLRVEWSAKSG